MGAIRTFLASRIGLAVAALLLLVASTSAEMRAQTSANAAIDWRGHYAYEADAGRASGGVEAMVSYELTVFEGDTQPAAKLSIEGYQSDETIFCDISPSGERLDVLFKSYDDGRTVNKYGVAQYRLGDVLFTLSKRGERLTTQWGKLRPDGTKKQQGVFFLKTKK